MIRFINPLPFVADMGRSKAFYKAILNLDILADHGNFVQFSNGFALHEGRSLYQTVFGRKDPSDMPYGRGNMVLYFEAEDLDAIWPAIEGNAEIIHGIEEQDWGQRVLRCFDPDRHIVEIGEPITGV